MPRNLNGPKRKDGMNRVRTDLLSWICERHASNDTLDRKILKRKALELAKQNRLKDFKCSDNWITIFLKKYGFSPTLTNCDGPKFSDFHKWIDIMRSRISKYKYEDLFHLDELLMYSNASPVIRESSSPMDQLSEIRKVSVLLCCNSTGSEKLPLLVFGKGYEYLIWENHVMYPQESLPEGSWISDYPFEEWILEFDNQMRRQNRRVLLFLRREMIQFLKDLQLLNISCIFLPKDFPDSLRPLKRDIFHYVKMAYRKKYLGRKEPFEWTGQKVLKTLVAAWMEVPQELIVASFQRTSFRMDNEFLHIDWDQWNEEKTGISFREFVTFDDDLSPSRYPGERPGSPKTAYGTRSKHEGDAISSKHFKMFKCLLLKWKEKGKRKRRKVVKRLNTRRRKETRRRATARFNKKIQTKRSIGEKAVQIPNRSEVDREGFPGDLEKESDSSIQLVSSGSVDSSEKFQPLLVKRSSGKTRYSYRNRENRPEILEIEEIQEVSETHTSREPLRKREDILRETELTVLDIVDCLAAAPVDSSRFTSIVEELYIQKVIDKVCSSNQEIRRRELARSLSPGEKASSDQTQDPPCVPLNSFYGPSTSGQTRPFPTRETHESGGDRQRTKVNEGIASGSKGTLRSPMEFENCETTVPGDSSEILSFTSKLPPVPADENSSTRLVQKRGRPRSGEERSDSSRGKDVLLENPDEFRGKRKKSEVYVEEDFSVKNEDHRPGVSGHGVQNDSTYREKRERPKTGETEKSIFTMNSRSSADSPDD